MSLPEIALITTGGTIAARPLPSGEVVVADSGEELLASVPELGGIARVRLVELFNIDSSLMTPPKMLEIARRVRALDRDENLAGFVVAHGTDTMEESAYLVDLLYAGERPVVFTGAQRNASERDFDGPRNLLDAARVATSPAARNLGAVIAMAGRIDAARDATKVHTTALEAFSSLDRGKLGEIFDGTVRIFRSRPRPANLASLDDIEPNVALVKLAAGTDGAFLRAARESGAAGIVLEALGLGNANPDVVREVERCTASGVPVLVVSRIPLGGVAPVYGAGHGLARAGALFGGNLSGQKARILLMAALAANRKTREPLPGLLDPHLEL